MEAAVVVYLRAAIGLLPGYMGTFADLRHSSLGYTQASSLSQFPQSLLTIEVYREAATMVMLVGVALLSASRTSARWAAFLWVFALVGYRILRRTLGHGAMARFAHRSRCALPYPGALDGAGVVPFAGKPFDCSCYCPLQFPARPEACHGWQEHQG